MGKMWVVMKRSGSEMGTGKHLKDQVAQGKLQCASRSPCLNRYCLVLIPKVSNRIGLGDPIICISKKFPDASDATVPGTTH